MPRETLCVFILIVSRHKGKRFFADSFVFLLGATDGAGKTARTLTGIPMRPNAKMYPYYGKFLAFEKGTLQKMRKMVIWRAVEFALVGTRRRAVCAARARNGK